MRIPDDDYCVVCGRYCGEGRHVCIDCAAGMGTRPEQEKPEKKKEPWTRRLKRKREKGEKPC